METQGSRKHWLIGFLVFSVVLSVARLCDPWFTIPFTQPGSLIAAALGIDERAMGFRYRDYGFLTPDGALVYSIPAAVIFGLLAAWLSKSKAKQTTTDEANDADKER